MALGLALWLGLAGCTHPGITASRQAPPPQAQGTQRIHGRVVDRVARMTLAGRVVRAAGQRTETDARGEFTLEGIAAPYDLAVIDKGGAIATVYQGLTGREVALVHEGKPLPQERWAPRSAHLLPSLTVKGGSPPPSGTAVVAFVAASFAAVSEPCALTGDGASCAPFTIPWDGPPSWDGELWALLWTRDPSLPLRDERSPEPLAGWAGHAAFRLETGRTPTVPLALMPLPTRHVRIAFSPLPPDTEAVIAESYRLPPPGGEIPLRRFSVGDAHELYEQLPDLRSLGASLCLTMTLDDRGTTSSTRCEDRNGELAFVLDVPPRLARPAQGAAFERDTPFTSDAKAGGVREFAWDAGEPTAEHPRVTLYTSKNEVTWPSIGFPELAFPKACSTYTAGASEIAPFATVDEAASPDGLAGVPRELRVATSLPVQVTVPRWPRPDPHDAFASRLCHYPYAQGIVCGGGTGQHDLETYVLSAINNKLRHFPELAKALDLYCVHDCATARRFVAGYAKYLKTHPGFDANEPLDMEPC